MTSIAPLITTFLRERLPVERKASEHTTDTYAYAFQLLFEFAAKRLKCRPSQLQLEQIDGPLVSAFLVHLEKDRGNRLSTLNARLAAVRSFMRFVEYRVPSALEQVRRLMAIPLRRTTSRLVDYLDREEIQPLLDAPDPTTWSGTRDRAMLHVAFAAGLRVSELVGLRMDGLSFGNRMTILVRGKGRKERALPLWKETSSALRAWLALRGSAPLAEVFMNARREPLTRSGFEYILRKHVRKAADACRSLSKKRVSPHVLRHSCAMATLQATGDIRKVALWLGHSSIQTTEIYTRANPKSRIDLLDRMAPPSLRRGRFRVPDKLIASLKD
jgi:site-specific recombinase XerD